MARPLRWVVVGVAIGVAALIGAFKLLSEGPNERVVVQPGQVLGRFKDLRGVNCGPWSPRGWDRALTLDLSSHYAKLGVKVIRFHDLWVVDELDTIFPNPDADPGDPRSYNFTALDRHVEAALKLADILILRIGYDWNDPPKNKPHVSFDKLAEVAKHIVLHYTKGWANGYNYKNIWFEIWNEPDIDWFWNLSETEFFELYEKVARAIKEANPDAVVGGPGIAWNVGFLDRFLAYTSSRGVPIDFVSWHIYTKNPVEVAERARAVRRAMERHGYGALPSVLTEWNFAHQEGEPWEIFRSSQAAAFQAAALILMEDAPVDIATLYRGDAWMWGGLFHSDGRPGKPYYVWLAYRELVEDSVRVAVVVERGLLYAMAGLKRDGSLRLLVVNYGSAQVRYEIAAEGYRVARVQAIDARRDLEDLECRGSICTIEPYSVQLLTLEKG
ncbi:MAG: cellulase family glycosylhydrolase [Thermofilaceae archaeon]